MKVQVNEIPIRHNGTLYEEGASFSLTTEQYERIKDHVTVLDETEGEPEKSLDEMTLPELKAYAKAHEIELGDVTKKDEILAILKGVTAAE